MYISRNPFKNQGSDAVGRTSEEMRKIITVLLLLLMLMSSASYGAVSEDVYVRKDVFDVHMQSINAKLDKILEEQQAQRKDINDLVKVVSVMSERIDRNFDTLSARMNGLDKRMDDQQHYLYLVLVLLGIIVALPAGQKMLQWHEERKDARKASITLEDVKRLIEENNARMTGKVQV